MDTNEDNQQMQMLYYIACILQSVSKSVENNTADTLTVLRTEFDSLLKPVLKVKRELKAKQAETKKLASDFDAFLKEVGDVIDSLEKDLDKSRKEYEDAKTDDFRTKVTQGWLKELAGYETRFNEICNKKKNATSK
jgi:hypothetical protein